MGDEVIHLHVISNKERLILREIGFDVSDLHWNKEYYIEALLMAAKILQDNPNIKGYFCEDSWVFDPFVYQTASDGEPYSAFDFLADDLIIGERFFVGDAKVDNKYYKQYEFALKSKRRKLLHEKGEFMPKNLFKIF